MAQINLKEKKIIYELSKDARQPASRIAQKVNLSKDSCIYTLNNLMKSRKVTRLITLINTESLGFNRHEIYFQVRDCDKEIIEYLTKHPMFLWVRSALGEWDILAEFYAKDVSQYSEIIRDIRNRFSKHIRKVDSAIVLEEYSYPLKCIGTNEEHQSMHDTKAEKTKIDDKDLMILKSLADNARTNVVDISGAAGLSSDAVIYRIKNMTKDRIIMGYRISVNEDILGLQKYKLIIRLEDMDDKTWKKLKAYLSSHKSVQYIKKTIGQWDLSITILAEDQEDLRKTVLDIRGFLKDYLGDCRIILLYQEHKNTYFPEGIFKELSRKFADTH